MRDGNMNFKTMLKKCFLSIRTGNHDLLLIITDHTKIQKNFFFVLLEKLMHMVTKIERRFNGVKHFNAFACKNRHALLDSLI